MADETTVEETRTSEGVQESAPSQTTEKKPELTEKEKAMHNLKRQAERLKAEGGDPAEVLGIHPQIKIEDDISDDTPLTVGTFRKMQKLESKKSAISMADDLDDEIEREEVKKVLQRLDPSGDAHADYTLALNAVNTERTRKVAQEQQRATQAKRTAAGSSQPAKPVDAEFAPTADELIFMRPPYNLSKEKILARRAAEQEKNQ